MFGGDTGRQRVHYLFSAAFSRNWCEKVNYSTSVVDVRTMIAVGRVFAAIALHEWRPKFRWFGAIIIKLEHKRIEHQMIIHFCSSKECKRLNEWAWLTAVKRANTLHNERERILDFILIGWMNEIKWNWQCWALKMAKKMRERMTIAAARNYLPCGLCSCASTPQMNYVIGVFAIESSMLIGEWQCAIQNRKPKPQSVRR